MGSRASGPGPDTQALLLELHQRLDAHFASLAAQRAAQQPPIPVFALEHGLTLEQSETLKSLVRASVRANAIPRNEWLPFVVYAAEIGYEYSGDEYWQTFEAKTPGWAFYGDRDYIRRMFRRFQQQFGGALPQGRWADQFSIICWPITHAVLPTDLQRHLARLLFDYRTALTTQLLADPSELGERLAARAWQASSRFQNFAQNTNLLGQVAAALLVGDDDDSPYLLGSTLRRIATDLSREREARIWLRDAKSAAIRVQTRGFRKPPATPGTRSSTSERLPRASDPSMLLRRTDDGWTAFIELEDLSGLADRLQSVYQELGRLRARVNGAAGPPLARGRLLFPNQTIRLAQWPSPEQPLISLEGGSEAVNSLLADQCVLSPGPVWVFRVRDDGTATEVRGKFVRPGHEYVVLTREPLPSERPDWIAELYLHTEGALAYSVSLPQTLAPADATVLKDFRLGTLAEVRIRPAGIIPALWDGEGFAEWVAGDESIVGISSSMAPAFCLVTVGGSEELIKWPKDEQEIFLRLPDMDIGSHDISVSVMHDGGDGSPTQGLLSIVKRAPSNRPSSGTFREGLLLLPTPVGPTLDEIWEGFSAVSIRGPRGYDVAIEFSLQDESSRVLASVVTRAALPLDEPGWHDLFHDQVFESNRIQQKYDESQAMAITVSEPNLGSVSLRVERDFLPLRWASGVSDDVPFVRLINNTGEAPKTTLAEFKSPDKVTVMPLTDDHRLQHIGGGLVTAETTTTRSSTILPPTVRNLADLQMLRSAPRIDAGRRTVSDVTRLLHLASRWASAAVPANPFAASARNSVLRAISRAIACLIAGEVWARVERRLEVDDPVNEAELRLAMGEQPYYRRLAGDLGTYAHQFRPLPLASRASLLAVALESNSNGNWLKRSETRFAEFLLRLASEPSALASWPSLDTSRYIQRVMDLPVLLRAARFIVIVLEEDSPSTRLTKKRTG